MMSRYVPSCFVAGTLAAFASIVLAAPGVAHAQSSGGDEQPTMTFEPQKADQPKKDDQGQADQSDQGTQGDQGQAQPEPEPEPEPSGDINLGADITANPKSTTPPKGGDEKVSWQDIVVVVRKPFLKVRRLELLPMWGITMNDNIIQHMQFSAELNYYLTDVLAVGIEGDYYIKNLRAPYDLFAREARRLPTVNKYNYGASLNFHYVPVYGKFAILDQHIIHWETYFTAGVGFTQSEVIPRDPAFQPFKNFLITPNIGASMRFFVTKFLTVNAGIRDYVFVDKFEAADRTEVNGEAAKANATSSLINNVVFQAGLSFWFPTSFEYTTFR